MNSGRGRSPCATGPRKYRLEHYGDPDLSTPDNQRQMAASSATVVRATGAAIAAGSRSSIEVGELVGVADCSDGVDAVTVGLCGDDGHRLAPEAHHDSGLGVDRDHVKRG
jgi:hypothetical protein